MWLSAPDPSTNYRNVLKQYCNNTGLWFLESDQYVNWKRHAAFSLWLYGIPGCGKTVLSSAILRDVLQHCDNDPGKVVVYFYFDFKDTQKQDPELMLRSLIYQLLQQCFWIPRSIDMLYFSCDNGQRQPSLFELLEVMQQMIQEFPHVYIILDALDECTKHSQLGGILKTMAGGQPQNLHVLVTSRRERYIESLLAGFIDQENMVCMTSKSIDMDIEIYVQQRLSNDRSLRKWQTNVTARQDIQTSLMKGARGMYGY